MEKKNDNATNAFYVFLGIVVLIIIAGAIWIFMPKENNETKEVSSQIKNENNKDIADKDVIKFAEEEIKKKLRYPDTARFKLKELRREQKQCLVDIYSISEDAEGNEGRLEFAVRIEETKNGLKYIDMGSNNDTCNIELAEEFERLMKNCDYEQVYNELFTTNLKQQIELEKFKGYKINMYAAEYATANVLADNSILTSFYDSVNKKSYLVTIKNGMITKFQQV